MKYMNIKRVDVSLRTKINRLNASTFLWPTSVVRQRRDVFDGLDIKSGSLQGCDGAFASAPRTVYLDVDFLHAEFNCFLRRLLGSQLPGKRSALTTSLKTTGPGGSPAERVTLGVGYGDRRIIEGGLNMGDPDGHATTSSASLRLRLGHCMRCSLKVFLSSDLLQGRLAEIPLSGGP